MDWDTIFGSVDKTRRLVIADPAVRTCSAASEIAATVSEERFDSLLAPVRRVTVADILIPFSPVLEREVLVKPADIVAGIRRVLEPATVAGTRLPG